MAHPEGIGHGSGHAHGHGHEHAGHGGTGKPKLRLVAWEITAGCNLKCTHCRMRDVFIPTSQELSHDEAMKLVDEIAVYAPLVLIVSGGEPLLRPDIHDIIVAANGKGIHVALATNGTLLDLPTVIKIKEEGVKRVSLSMDGASDAVHDTRRGLAGARISLMKAVDNLNAGGLPFQINTTVTTSNVDELKTILDMVPKMGAVAHHIFMFVPTGHGVKIAHESLSKDRYEEVLKMLAAYQETSPIEIQVTCGPTYQRVLVETGHQRKGGGCMAGTGFVFVSSDGGVYPCGYLPVEAGSVRKNTFGEVYEDSPVFKRLRDRTKLTGNCGTCNFKNVCGGCRARAYSQKGDFMAGEPCCMVMEKPDQATPTTAGV